jgi:DNA-binding PadR family transcriptional regulator
LVETNPEIDETPQRVAEIQAESFSFGETAALARLVAAGVVGLTDAVLYGTIRRMLNQGLIREADQRPDPALDDERRRYYCITALGKRVAQAEVARLSRLLDAAKRKKIGQSA